MFSDFSVTTVPFFGSTKMLSTSFSRVEKPKVGFCVEPSEPKIGTLPELVFASLLNFRRGTLRGLFHTLF